MGQHVQRAATNVDRSIPPSRSRFILRHVFYNKQFGLQVHWTADIEPEICCRGFYCKVTAYIRIVPRCGKLHYYYYFTDILCLLMKSSHKRMQFGHQKFLNYWIIIFGWSVWTGPSSSVFWNSLMMGCSRHLVTLSVTITSITLHNYSPKSISNLWIFFCANFCINIKNSCEFKFSIKYVWGAFCLYLDLINLI